ncbi:polyamine ABC transporter substrate-binding protein [Phreatobacter stygius]|uniref:Putrescine-binding periplasmic protein n=1 Tax=Phreatobacter stygius TaxID=1940610 RepID=A0A4D7B3U0_9HYPH|nr:polyamine ABC transporter substrate-binding protein [Phreatobacter stygius]QCI64710.1 polyamine ABC transporter substrate-binding protein [Phreatobacter stygius]
MRTRILLKGLVAAFATLGLAAIAEAQGTRELRIFNWSNYIDEQVLRDFEREFNAKVIYDTYDSNEVLETRLLAGRTGYDIVVPSGPFLSRQIAANVHRRLEPAKIPNLANLWPDVQRRVAQFDPGNAYSVNYLWGTTGIGYNVAKIRERMADAPLDSWKLAFDFETLKRFKDCGIHFLDTAEDLLPSVMRYLGRDPNSKRAEDWEAAAAHIQLLRTLVTKFHSSEYISALANGDICLVVGYSGDVFQAQKRAKEAGNGIDIQYVIPREGAQMWFDQMAIPADAPNPDLAQAFINYLLRPEVGARVASFVSYASGNLAARPLVLPAVRDNPSIYPPDAVMARLFNVTSPDARLQRVITRAWTRAKTGR